MADKTTLTSPRAGRAAAEVQVRIHRPSSAKLDGVMVMVPGQGYHKNMPLMRRPAEALAMSGIGAVRFDWAYTRSGAQPSATLDDEVADLAAVMDHVRELGWDKVLLVGKSLGCIVAARAAEKLGAAGLVWLTPPLHTRESAERAFPGSEHMARVHAPLLVVAGNRDPLCHLDKLAAFIGRCPAATRLLVMPGDHSLEAETTQETDTTIATLIRWLGVWAGLSFGR